MTSTPSNHDVAEEMRDFDDFADVLTGGGLALPISGTVYTIAPCDAETGLYLTRLFGQMERVSKGQTSDVADFSDGEEIDLFHRVLGQAFDDMAEDGVSWHAMRLAMAAGWTYHVHGEQSARAVWNAGGDPKALQEHGNRQTRRARAATSRTATSTDEGDTTPTPDSTSGTNSRQGSAPSGNRPGTGTRRRRRR